jgi:glucose-6-phosphate-specific signal transduction histidine kinase
MNGYARSPTIYNPSVNRGEDSYRREIHDELGQALTAIKMDLAWFKKKVPENDTYSPGGLRPL